MCGELLGETNPVKMRDGATKILNETLRRLPDAEVSDEGKNVIEAFVTRSKSPSDIPSRCETSVNERYWEIVQSKNDLTLVDCKNISPVKILSLKYMT